MAVMIPFNNPYIPEKALAYIKESLEQGHLSGDGCFSKKCSAWLEERIECRKALLTPSGSAALEMAALLADIRPGDEVIMPSFAYPSTANAFVLRGGVPVFVDIRPDTCNLDGSKIEAAITGRTRAIVPLHYAGIPCEMDTIMELAEKHGLLVIEDTAQSVLSHYKRRPAGSIGHLAALSFHETKNLMSGEGGALLINDPRFIARAEILREKGTDRVRYLKGEVDKYTWIDIGSSYLMNELTAALLLAQFEAADETTARRVSLWREYQQAFSQLEKSNKALRPSLPIDCTTNGHIYYLILSGPEERRALIGRLRDDGIEATFHYVPLHSSPAGKKFGCVSGDLSNTDRISGSLVRLPLWPGMEKDQERVIAAVVRALGD
ncbi:MAG TPA: dTDP-4-amino-4,6-dideoxygalactose transaminase [Candidatus Omnitrophota bacterium]|nr:dTDP-4-amino-4,6-dideoxygalactose transaminase [Candidatus Omnitrophota bacterium]